MATQIVGLLAGVVTTVYMLGGVVLAVRLLIKGLSVDSVVSVLGQLPRETVIGTAMVDVIGPAVLLGVIAALLYAALYGPDKHGTPRSLTSPEWEWRRPVVVAIAALLALPALTVAVVEDGFDWLLGTSVVGIVVTSAALFAARSEFHRYEPSLARLERALLAGLIWAGVTITPALMVAGAIPFDSAQACLNDEAEPVSGPLVADTDDRLLLIEDEGDGQAVRSIPSARIRQLEFGDPDAFPPVCPPPPAAQAGDP